MEHVEVEGEPKDEHLPHILHQHCRKVGRKGKAGMGLGWKNSVCSGCSNYLDLKSSRSARACAQKILSDEPGLVRVVDSVCFHDTKSLITFLI